MSNSKLCALLAFALLLVLGVAPAHAQATRTWVSGVGDDANPCSRTAPCKTFAGAISKTAAGGEISVLDPGGYGAVTITKSISIVNDYSGEAGILAAGTNGVTVNAAGAIVKLRGLVIDGAPPASPGLNGIRFLAGAVLHVQKCVIKNFTSAAVGNGNGINFIPGAGIAELYVSDTVIQDNGSGANGRGISIAPTGTGGASVVLNRVLVQNSAIGINADASAGSGGIKMTVFNSEVSGNTNGGIGTTANANSAKTMISRSAIANNGTNGVVASGAGASVWLDGNTISGNTTALLNSGGQLFSYKNNSIDGNGALGSVPAAATLQ